MPLKKLAIDMFLTVHLMRIKMLSFEVKFNLEKQLLAQCTSALEVVEPR